MLLERVIRNNLTFVQENLRLGDGEMKIYSDVSINWLTDLYIIRKEALTYLSYRD